MYNLDGLNFYAEPTLEDTVLSNVREFLRYGFLQVGAYINVDISKDESQLVPLTGRPGVDDYTIYKSRKPDWVWETNIDFKDNTLVDPIVPSGIFVNNTFVPTGVQVSGVDYRIDFSRGQVVFNESMPSDMTVKVPHTLRYVSVYDSDSYQDRELNRSWHEMLDSSGVYDDQISKLYMPAIVVDVVDYQTIRGSQLGSRGKHTAVNISFNIFADSPSNRKRLTDICYLLESKYLELFDPKIAPKPLNHLGELINPDASWPNLSENYKLYPGSARFDEKARVFKIKTKHNIPIFKSIVKIGLELDVYPK